MQRRMGLDACAHLLQHGSYIRTKRLCISHLQSHSHVSLTSGTVCLNTMATASEHGAKPGACAVPCLHSSRSMQWPQKHFLIPRMRCCKAHQPGVLWARLGRIARCELACDRWPQLRPEAAIGFVDVITSFQY